MVNKEALESTASEVAASGKDEDLVELGCASRETRGLFLGVITELSILPLRLF